MVNDCPLTVRFDIVALFFAVAVMVARAVETYRINLLVPQVKVFDRASVETTVPETLGLQSASEAVTVKVVVFLPSDVEPEKVSQVMVQVPLFALGICA